MKAAELYELIGEVDEKAVQDAAKPDRRSRKLYAAVLGIAAAVCIGAAGVWMLHRNAAPVPQDAASSCAETAVESRDIRIYYYRDGEMHSETKFLPCTPEQVFGEWKKQNGIGEEVRLIASRVENNGMERIESGVAEYSAGDIFILHLTVTENLKAYYSEIPETDLLESLRLTMTGYSYIEYNDFDLTLK